MNNDYDEKMRRFAFLSGYTARNDKEEEEVHRLQRELQEEGRDPGWTVYPRTEIA